MELILEAFLIIDRSKARTCYRLINGNSLDTIKV